jgi:PP-loop superfamily ATP-utilizing enzyme
MDVFFKKIKEIEDNIMKILNTNKEIEMTEEDKRDFNNATKCYLCNEDIKPEGTDDKKRW